MKLSITLVHNKTPQENEAQIESLRSHLKTVTDGPFVDLDSGNVWTTTHHEIVGLDIPHEVRVYQVVPFGVTPPPNRGAINSGGIVYYGKGDEDKTGTHPRFFNWGLKRGTDNGAEISLYLEDVSTFSANKLRGHITAITKRPDNVDFVEDTFGKVATLNLLKVVGQLKEDRSLPGAIADLKNRNVGKGLKNG